MLIKEIQKIISYILMIISQLSKPRFFFIKNNVENAQ